MEWSQPTQGQKDPFTWFTESQLRSVFGNGSVPDWFHGTITRKTAEERLTLKPPGYFLIRVSESRVGYTLSYREDEHCRHFMIDVLEDGQYIIIGENRTHRSLQDLVDFHRRNPILPFNQVLTVACGQSSANSIDYAELLFSQRPRSYSTSVLPSNLRQPNPSQPQQADELPPALPYRPNNLRNSALFLPNSQPNRLYPSLEEDFQHFTSPLPASPAPNMRKSSPWIQPPEVPLRNHVVQKQNLVCGTTTTLVSDSSSTPTATERKLFTNNQPVKSQNLMPLVAVNLKSIKKKFQKKMSNPQENVYAEITDGPNNSSAVMENEYQEITGELTFRGPPQHHTDVRLNNQMLPQEYRSPPPFAPGY
ncbi:hematopoietic SH2 domain-containing protein homolog [Poeciliopsis prolifica]|uniref:hematopoietic SH2 domain-containing protein homolog n=1 Tax=Poeciliopsis prolifica TaxID=188132 RepID=UPI00241351DF|nr:hematopoietic SH2 domain-containing protein homolog [Poeciliopsis prolifica]XP_054876572.1 hematopoietic SH2 domain-containing protein homolog [Poeciliopsis prolifica]